MGLLRAKYLRSTAEKTKGKMMDGWMDGWTWVKFI